MSAPGGAVKHIVQDISQKNYFRSRIFGNVFVMCIVVVEASCVEPSGSVKDHWVHVEKGRAEVIVRRWSFPLLKMVRVCWNSSCA